MFGRLRLPVAVLGASACVTVSSVRQEPLDLGLLAFYSRSPDVAIGAACQALRLEGATLESVGPRDSATLVLGAWGWFTRREVARVTISRLPRDTATVRVLSRPTADREPRILTRMDSLLGGPVLGPGLRVRAWSADTAAPVITGSVLSLPLDTLVLLSEPNGTRAAIAFTGVRRVDIQRGRLHHGTLGGVIGGLTGLIVGAVLGYQAGDEDCTNVAFGPCFERSETAIIGGLLGAGVGIGVGQGIGRAFKSDRWVPAPRPPGAATLSTADAHPPASAAPCPDSLRQATEPQPH